MENDHVLFHRKNIDPLLQAEKRVLLKMARQGYSSCTAYLQNYTAFMQEEMEQQHNEKSCQN